MRTEQSERVRLAEGIQVYRDVYAKRLPADGWRNRLAGVEITLARLSEGRGEIGDLDQALADVRSIIGGA